MGVLGTGFDDQIFDAIWTNRAAGSLINPKTAQLIHSAAHLLRFVTDAESDRVLAQYNSGLQSRLCAGSLREFSNNNLMAARYGRDAVGNFYADTNLIAHWINLGYVDEATIRDGTSFSRSSPTRSCTITKRTLSLSC